MRIVAAGRSRCISLLALIALLFGLCVPAMASLGGDTTSVEVDREQMKAGIAVTQTDTYTVHEMKAPTGTVVREYVSAEGRVFGVAWQGPFIPDLKQILGAYFQQYSAAVQSARSRGRGGRAIHVQQPGLVVEGIGHMRAYSGRAYDPGLLPPGVTGDAVR
jgi:uncharacterized protein DUF2844